MEPAASPRANNPPDEAGSTETLESVPDEQDRMRSHHHANQPQYEPHLLLTFFRSNIADIQTLSPWVLDSRDGWYSSK